MPGQNDLATNNPALAAEWHPTKNGALTPQMVTAISGKKVWWQCKSGHEWQATVAHRSNGCGCPYCSGKMVLVGFNDLATMNPALAAEWHPTKNGELTPQMVTVGCDKKVWWQCENGHESGCPACHHFAVTELNSLAAINPWLAEEWDYERNAPETPETVAANSNIGYWWKCAEGHHWKAVVSNRNIFGHGCPYCSRRIPTAGENDLQTLNPALAAQWHPTRNGDLTPAKVFPTSDLKVWWQCEKGHTWQASIAARNSGSGCPMCIGRKQYRGHYAK